MTSEYSEYQDKVMKEIENTNKALLKVSAIVDNHEQYISDGKKWRVTLMIVAAGWVAGLIGNIYMYGRLIEKVDNNTRLSIRNEMRLDKNDERFERLIREARNYFRDN